MRSQSAPDNLCPECDGKLDSLTPQTCPHCETELVFDREARLVEKVRKITPYPLIPAEDPDSRWEMDGMICYIGKGPRVRGRRPVNGRAPVKLIEDRIWGEREASHTPVPGVRAPGVKVRRVSTLCDQVEQMLLRGWMDLDSIRLHIHAEIEEGHLLSQLQILLGEGKVIRKWRMGDATSYHLPSRGEYVYALNPDWKEDRLIIDPQSGLEVSQADNEFDD